ncbi:cAMP-dependent protein kinase type I-alpha regulatory subunit [Paramecium bursaria]
MSSKKQIIHEYLYQKVKPVYDELISKILIERPDDVIQWSIDWLHNKSNCFCQILKENTPALQQPINKPHHTEHSDEEPEEEEEIVLDLQNKQKKNTRTAVSAEAYGVYHKKEDFKARVIPKGQEQKDRIKKRILNSFMFQALDEKDLHIVIDAMEEKKFKPQDWVITQGQDGNELYVIDEGDLDCFKKFGEEVKHLKVYHPGDSFGELALLYNAPRAASIQAKTDVITFALDRDTFNNIVKQSAVTKREKMEHILGKIELLQSMDAYERIQLSDGMKEVKFHAGEVIINQGEVGDKIYLIAEGNLEAWKHEEGQESHKVYDYKEGDYFGELALLNNTPRQATVKAVSDGVLVYCDYQSFRRLMGPLEDILRRNQQRYEHYLIQK